MAVYGFTTIGAFGVDYYVRSPYKRQGEAEWVDNFKVFLATSCIDRRIDCDAVVTGGYSIDRRLYQQIFAVFAWFQSAKLVAHR